jgi:hypothetical protein
MGSKGLKFNSCSFKHLFWLIYLLGKLIHQFKPEDDAALLNSKFNYKKLSDGHMRAVTPSNQNPTGFAKFYLVTWRPMFIVINKDTKRGEIIYNHHAELFEKACQTEISLSPKVQLQPKDKALHDLIAAPALVEKVASLQQQIVARVQQINKSILVDPAASGTAAPSSATSYHDHQEATQSSSSTSSSLSWRASEQFQSPLAARADEVSVKRDPNRPRSYLSSPMDSSQKSLSKQSA